MGEHLIRSVEMAKLQAMADAITDAQAELPLAQLARLPLADDRYPDRGPYPALRF
jgi:hypothetical protein